MKVAVIGLGKIGLPLAVQFGSKGHVVVGVDINSSLVEVVNEGTEPFPGETGLAQALQEVITSGALRATTLYEAAVPSADVVVVLVPLVVDPTTDLPSFDQLDDATTSVARNLTRGSLVIYETTLPVGTTRNRWRPLIEQVSGLAEGNDFDLVFSPERVFSGRIFADLSAYPKLIGGLSVTGAARAQQFYESVLEFEDRPDLPRPNGVWDLGSPEAAEFEKLAETTYRDVNIGLANQFARHAQALGIDVHEVIAAANSQPFSHIHKPGISVGGHCIPVYPRLYLWNDPDASVVAAARQANVAMPAYAIDLLASAYGDLGGAVVAVLGVSYRGGVKETAFSGVFAVCRELSQRGAIPRVHDPLFSDDELGSLGLEPYRFGTRADAVVLHTDHPEYRGLGESDFPGVAAIVDGRRVTSAENWSHTVRRVI